MISFKRAQTFVDENKTREMFEKYDKDKNGTIEKKEFIRIMIDILKELDENLSFSNQLEIAEEGFLKFDLDKNKKLEYDEFYDFMRFIISEKGYEL